MSRSIAYIALTVALAIGGVGTCLAQSNSTPPATAAGKPAADTKDPGKTATDAITRAG